jgi:hypothetical protein
VKFFFIAVSIKFISFTGVKPPVIFSVRVYIYSAILTIAVLIIITPE